MLHARDDVDLESRDDKGRTAPEMANEYRGNLVALNSEKVRERIRILSDILMMFEFYGKSELTDKSFNV